MINNKLKNILLVFCFVFLANSLLAQQYSVSGTLTDAESGETLIGVNVTIKEIPGTGTSSNEYGFYSVTLDSGNYTLQYSYIGFDLIEKQVTLNQDQTINIALGSESSELQEIVIRGEKEEVNVTSTEVGVEKVNIKEIDKIPVLFGEKDVLKTIQLLPGVKSAGEGTSGFFVRGGTADQNLILLDEAPVYNASHLFGFFSVFNSDAIKDLKLYKGSIPAKYGGRLSSALDIRMRDGNKNKISGNGGIGLISSRLTLEGPIVKGKSSFIVSGRRTYADAFVPLAGDAIAFDDVKLFFYDFNAKVNYTVNDKNRLFLSGYFGRDRLALGDFLDFNWGNATGTLRWNHIFSPKLFSNTSFILSNYDYGFSFIGGELSVASTILDYNLKQSFDYFLNNKNTLHFGFNAIYHIFDPGSDQSESGSEGLFQFEDIEKRYSTELAAYISNEQKVTDKISLDYGLRINNFTPMGEGNILEFDEDGNVTGSTFYKNFEAIENYFGLAPRFSASILTGENSSIKTAYAKTYQYLHLLSNTTSSQPTDVWLPSSQVIKPQISDQISVGFFRNFEENSYEFSAETYFRTLQNIIDYRPGAQVSLNPEVEGLLLFGKGRAYGLELYLKKKKGLFTGWISYTLARTENKFEELNNKNWFPARQDRTHDISIVGSYLLNERIDIAASWVYYTGNAITWPGAKYPVQLSPANVINGTDNGLITVGEYEFRNNERLPAYHRLDLSVTLRNKEFKFVKDVDGTQKKIKKRWQSSWNFSAYNAYNRENPYSISFVTTENSNFAWQAEQLTLFKIVPAVTYNFNF